MSESKEITPLGHRIEGPYQETRWPRQWIAMCSCTLLTRCEACKDAAYRIVVHRRSVRQALIRFAKEQGEHA